MQEFKRNLSNQKIFKIQKLYLNVIPLRVTFICHQKINNWKCNMIVLARDYFENDSNLVQKKQLYQKLGIEKNFGFLNFFDFPPW